MSDKKYSFGRVRPLLMVAGLVGLVGCATGGGVYKDAGEEQILGDRWNNTDGNKTAKHMVDSILSAAWLEEYRVKNKGKKPVVIVDEVENRTDEHIDTRALTEYIRSNLINSRKVRFLNAARRKKILNELKYQNSGAVSADSAKKTGRQIGADYMIGGALSNVVSVRGDLKTVTYQTDLNLTNLETSEIEWNGLHKIKKAFKR